MPDSELAEPRYRSPLLDRPGAVPADGPDDGVALHYGDPLGEQRVLETGNSGNSLVDLSHRGVVRIDGADRLSWLHSLTTQHLTDLKPHQATSALLLSPRGHLENLLYLVDDGATLWIHTEPGQAAPLVAFLDRMRFLLDVRVADVTAERAVVFEPVTEPVPDQLCLVTGYGRYLLLERAGLPGYATDRHLAGSWAQEALRIARHQPRFGLESDHRTIPHELGLIGSAVHLDKGCYRGQETVARVHNLGRPPRRLVFLHLDGSVERLPEPDAPVELDGRPVGRVTSAARHFELGPIALAVVKRNTPTEVELLAGGVAAAQEVVVPG